MTGDPAEEASLDRRLRDAANTAVVFACRRHGLDAQVVDLPEGEEIEVLAVPLIPVRGARFFLRVELAAEASDAEHRTIPPKVAVPTRMLRAWRTVPEPVAVVVIDPDSGNGRIGVIHPFLAALDHHHAGWDRHPSVLVPLSDPLAGGILPRLAREAADAHVVFRRVVDAMEEIENVPPPQDLGDAVGRLRQRDFDFTVACVDLLKEAGILVEKPDRNLEPVEEIVAAFARAAVQHGVHARGHLDPETAAQVGRSAVARVLLSRLPALTESTAARAAIVLARFLPVEDTDAILRLADDPVALTRVLMGGGPGADDDND